MATHTKISDRKTAKGLGSAIQHNIQNKLTAKHLAAGDISKKIPVHLSDGKTIVFAKSQDDVERVRKFWEEKTKHIVIINKD